MPEPSPHSVTAVREAERLMHGGSFEQAVMTLQNVADPEPTVAAISMLASLYLELGELDTALQHATAAVERDACSVQARDVLARVNLALGDYFSALLHYDVIAHLSREQNPLPPDKYSIPAHIAFHNIEQVQHILAVGSYDEQAFPGIFAQELDGLSRRLFEVIDGSNGTAPVVSVQGRNSRIIADPPYVRVSEERLPAYVNTSVDYRPIQQGIVTGREKFQIIDDFLTPDALQQVQKFCLESTVWRHPYQFGYVGAFPQDGFAIISLLAIAEEFRTVLGDAFDEYQLAQWWAFSYDSKLPGTDIHGDDADFTLNLWITPDSANLDKETGGLVIWDKKAPDDWSFNDYNSGGDRVRQFLKDQNAESTTIPYRANRAVVFEGHLFHQTDEFTFAPGFANRRRSLTFLFRRSKRRFAVR
ncbi:MAG: bacterial transcriptional activator domain-containing protein [Mycobacterium sp.]|nr:bacterial transcriptional activator domain-containing protein [Mycobacterium sp.]